MARDSETKPLLPSEGLIYIACPMCCLNRKLHKTGMMAERLYNRPLKPRGKGRVLGDEPKGRIRFGSLDLESSWVVQVRDPKRGPEGGGLQMVDGQTLEEMVADPAYSDLIDQMRERCKEILKIVGKGR